jgi:small subunit ribosomal protein S20
MYNLLVAYDDAAIKCRRGIVMAKLKTGRHTSALKEARKAKKRAERNKAIKSKIRTSIKRVKEAVKNNNVKAAQEHLNVAFSEWDKAAKRNIVHYKAASNQKARLSKLVTRIITK